LFALLANIEAVAPGDGLFAESTQDAGGRIDLFELEARAAGKSLIALKATPALSRDFVEQQMLGRPGMRAIFVVRRLIDSYVSLAKATALDAWRDTDLTPVKVKLDAERFGKWMAEQEAWYAHWKGWLERRGLPLPILRYETHLSVPADAVLRRFAATAAQVGITLRVPPALPFTGLKKQDREKAVALKVKNWPEFSRALTELGIEKRAFGYPI
jgi:LPS sulfotransferase NodH